MSETSAELDELWREFGAETLEHLEALIWLLSDRDGAAWTGDEIARLFRYFHSLKGSFLAMGFVNLEALAHRAEDILSLVRDGKAVLDAPLADVLLRTVDRMIGLRERAVARRRDADLQEDLLLELEHQHAAHADVAAPIVSPSPDLPIDSDPEMLAIYSELLDQRLPLVAGALSDDPAIRAEAAETAGELAHGADMMGFAPLAETLQSIARLAPDPAGRAALPALLDELHQQAALIEEITGAPSGAAKLAAALGGSLGGDAKAAVAALAAAFDQPADAIFASAREARGVFNALGHEQAAGLLLLIEEQLGRGDQALGPALFDQAFAILEALHEAAEAGADVPGELARAVAFRWQAAMAGADADAAPAAVSSGFPLPAEVVATLSAEQRARLDQAFADDSQHAYELLLELESNPETAERLMDWLGSAVETITSRTVMRSGASGFEFLVLSPQPIEWLRTQLDALDPDQLCLLDLREVARGQATLETRAETVAAALLRVRSEDVDGLMTEIGEMRGLLAGLREILRHGALARAAQALRRLALEPAQAASLGPLAEAAAEELRGLGDLEEALGRAHRRAWDAGLALRVMPVEALFARLARYVRDLAQKLGKPVDLVIEGRDVRIDKSMIDLLADPLMHIVRNALDHGIESADKRAAAGKPARARLLLAAAERTHGVHITIADDGRGLDKGRILVKAVERGLVQPAEATGFTDKEVYALIFRPGFSTADVVTDISGRGVGLDVVATALQRGGGICEVETEPGLGTRFILKLPISAALVRALMVRVDGEILALPERHVAAVLELDRDAIAGGSIVHAGGTVPVHALAMLLGFAEAAPVPGELVRIVILESSARRIGLVVDQCLRFQDLFLKEVSPLIGALPAVGGAAVLGDGQPVLVLDAEGLMALAIQPL